MKDRRTTRISDLLRQLASSGSVSSYIWGSGWATETLAIRVSNPPNGHGRRGTPLEAGVVPCMSGLNAMNADHVPDARLAKL